VCVSVGLFTICLLSSNKTSVLSSFFYPTSMSVSVSVPLQNRK
jgi:hypothetical protein